MTCLLVYNIVKYDIIVNKNVLNITKDINTKKMHI